MFRAGQAAGKRSVRRWRFATLITLTTAGTLLLALASLSPWGDRTGGNPARQLAAGTPTPAWHRPVTPAPTGAEAATSRIRSSHVAATEYLRLREQVLLQGVEALPSVRWAPLSETAGLTAGSWRPHPSAAEPVDRSLWQPNLNDKTKRS